MHGRDENAYDILVGKLEGKRPLGRRNIRILILILEWMLGKWGGEL
jgi:hypothetical protein